ncbi:MAG: LysR substrate-binding domain-containing protein [Flavobacteriales bacterium]|jgi:LysR family hydrogen peroxide-inducible transcriptional activator|nr:LysR substrate-binding domain-containing protein [Flavobacteriales bacterium]
MTLQQLEYIVAIDTHRHFAKAAAACFVTQPTLSGMVKKLEEELGTVLFDRSKSPVVPTAEGVRLVAQARTVLREAGAFMRLARETRDQESGELRIGVIPTLAPYLLPLFLGPFMQARPQVRLSIAELTTETIVDRLARETLDVGLMATPLKVPGLRERPLFTERFMVFAAPGEMGPRKRYVLPGDIDPDRLWLLEEGHCMRSQVLNLCALRREGVHGRLHYLSGSIGSLMRLVRAQGGVTIVPELAAVGMDKAQRAWLHPFKAPAPAREISAVTYRHALKDRLLDLLCTAIVDAVDGHLGGGRTELVPIEEEEAR